MTDAKDRLPQVMTGHIKTAAYAGECRLCPPPLFLIFVSFFQIGFFVHQVRRLEAPIFNQALCKGSRQFSPDFVSGAQASWGRGNNALGRTCASMFSAHL